MEWKKNKKGRKNGFGKNLASISAVLFASTN